MSDQPIDFTQRNIAIDILRAVTMCVMIFESTTIGLLFTSHLLIQMN